MEYVNEIKMDKKGGLTTKSIFFIMMSLIMIWIIFFGINKILLVEKTLTNQEKIIIKKEIKDALKYCQDPLNKGNLKTIKLDKFGFNSICIINNSMNLNNLEIFNTNPQLIKDGKKYQNSINVNDSIVLLMKTSISSNKEILEANIVNKIEFKDMKINNFCQWDLENKDKLNLKIQC